MKPPSVKRVRRRYILDVWQHTSKMFGPFTRFTVLLALPVSMNDRRAKSRKRRAAGLRIYRVECDEVEIEELLSALGYRGDIETSLSAFLSLVCRATCPDMNFADVLSSLPNRFRDEDR